MDARVIVAVALVGCAPAGSTLPAPACADRAVVASQADVARLASCQALGGLTIRTGAALDASRLRVRSVAGDVLIGPTVGIEDISLGELREVGGAIRVVGNGLLRGLYLPALERAGRIEIEANAALTTIALPALAAVRGGVQITDNAALEAVEIPALMSVGEALVLTGEPRLALVETGALRAGSVEIGATALPVERVEALRAAAAR